MGTFSSYALPFIALPFSFKIPYMRRGGQAFASSLHLLAYVRVTAWNEPKGYGFGSPCDEGGKLTSKESLHIHPANFVKKSGSKAPTSIKPGAVIQGDVVEKNGKPILKNITNREGAALSAGLAFVGTHVDQNLMSKNLPCGDSATPTVREDISIDGTSLAQASKAPTPPLDGLLSAAALKNANPLGVAKLRWSMD